MAANNSIRHSSDKGQCDNSSDGGDRPSDKVGAHPMANEIRLKPEVQVRHNECDHEYHHTRHQDRKDESSLRIHNSSSFHFDHRIRRAFYALNVDNLEVKLLFPELIDWRLARYTESTKVRSNSAVFDCFEAF